MKTLLSLILSVILIMASTSASGEDINIKGKFGFGMIGGVAIHRGDVIDKGTYTGPGSDLGSSDADNSGVYGFDIFYGFTERIALDLTMTYRKTDIKVDGSEWGDVKTISLIPSIQFRYPLSQTVTPYIDVGMGININSFNESSSFNANNEDVIMDNSLALKIGTGLDFFARENLILNVALDWIYNKGDTVSNVTEDTVINGTTVNKGRYRSWETDLSGFNLMFGIRYLF